MKRTADSPLGVWPCVWQRKETNLKAYDYVFVHYNNTQTHRFTHTHTRIPHVFTLSHMQISPKLQTATQANIYSKFQKYSPKHRHTYAHTHTDLWHYAVSRTTGYVKKQKDQGNKKNMKSYKSVAPHEIAVEVR